MTDTFSRRVRDWYDTNARDLPWRSADATAWGVLVSEVMLQQTPVARVEPAWHDWMTRWPTPAALAADSPGEAVRMWGRLGYPRRALRLHESATAMVARHDGAVPSAYDELLALPGIGTYTAAAVASFGFGARHAVLDTNVRRVYARVFDGRTDVTTASPNRGETEAALARVPADEPARYSVAVMELGALLCTARAPRCGACPVNSSCAWLLAGRPETATARKTQTYAGTDRQVRGKLLAVLREGPDVVAKSALDLVWDDSVQRERALAGLLEDGLVEAVSRDAYRLPA
jgi:A/G-specific adenine glycosylase